MDRIERKERLKKRMVLNMFLSLITVFIFAMCLMPDAYADSSIKIVIDGERINSEPGEPEPFIENSRTLVPIRIVSEKLGAHVEWDGENRTVEITKGDKRVFLRIESNLIEYGNGEDKTYNLSDVAPFIVDSRTFVPLRLVSNALGVGIGWNNESRTVTVDSSETSGIEPFFDMKITSVEKGQTITGTTELNAEFSEIFAEKAAEIKYLLLDQVDAKGFIIARGNSISESYEWVPETDSNGEKILVAALYDSEGKFLAGDSIPVKVKINPEVVLTGLTEDEKVSQDKVPLGVKLNFTAAHVKYEMINNDTGAYYISNPADPTAAFNMIPVFEDNGSMSIRVIAYDAEGNEYPSRAVNISVDVEPEFSFKGATEGSTIEGRVTLSVSRNFNVTDTEYMMEDPKTDEETVLYEAAYGSYSWFPGPELNGEKILYARVTGTDGTVYTSKKVRVIVDEEPQFLLQGIGPKQLVTDKINLKVLSNVTTDEIEYVLTNAASGRQIVTASDFIPAAGDDGLWTVKARGTYGKDEKFETEEVQFTVYTGELYGPQPVTEKSNFINFASEMAVAEWKEKGMSAALQTAQAILETGWGQSVPVDKYDGQMSNKLFGVKGTGTAGSVTSNTWEEYNGVSYRIDAEFRAYNTVSESWEDHNELLLTAGRYEPFRQAMYDSTLGAWALKRCGYATDSQYPAKLIQIIHLYDLKELDKVGI
jgi:hypothetical protein